MAHGGLGVYGTRLVRWTRSTVTLHVNTDRVLLQYTVKFSKHTHVVCNGGLWWLVVGPHHLAWSSPNTHMSSVMAVSGGWWWVLTIWLGFVVQGSEQCTVPGSVQGTWQVRGGGSTSTVTVDSTTLTGLTVWNKTLTYNTVTVDSTTLTGLTVWNKTLTYNTVTVDSTTLTGLTVWNKTLTYNTVTVDSTTLTGLTVWNKTLTYNTVTVDSTTLTGLTVWNKTLTYNTVTVDSTTLTGLTVWNKTLTYNTVTVDSTTLTGLTVWNKTLTYNTVTVDSTTLTGLTVWNKTLTYNCFQQQGDYYVYSSEQTSLFDSYAVKIYFCWCLQAVATGYKLYELSDKVLETGEERGKAYLITTTPTINDVCDTAFSTNLQHKAMEGVSSGM
ncbi:hypothetical protein BaRGS_00034345 [Batillaria attramentaria]|uniref:Uncharacterized protein n=1 Tax=Batillaria attramentaria TaxID=370345 RepID=A0ABD0JI71_9CAEN